MYAVYVKFIGTWKTDNPVKWFINNASLEALHVDDLSSFFWYFERILALQIVLTYLNQIAYFILL